MTQHCLQQLGPIGFQDVVAALANAALGAQVRPMGSGRDGGRDLLIDGGRLVWGPHADNAEVWEGTTVFQVKHKEKLGDTRTDVGWFWRNIRAELDAWADPGSGRGDVPHYLVFVTNVRLSPAPDSGGYDTINTQIRQHLAHLEDESAEDVLERSQRSEAKKHRLAQRDRMRRLQKWRIWDGYQIDSLLDAHEGVRLGFSGLLTPGDVLATLSRLSTSLDQEELCPVLGEHARRTLLSQRRVYFDEAGASETVGVPVEEVAVDLPVLVSDSPHARRAVSYVLDRGEHVLKPGLTTTIKPRHLVLTGAPGNGKSTITKFLTQVYRSVFVSGQVSLTDEHKTAITNAAQALHRMDVHVPRHRRWPMNVDLAKFAIDQGISESSLLRWIADLLNTQASAKAVQPWVLHGWLKQWPSFIVLDGLDEVTEPSVRRVLISTIESFVAEAEAEGWDVLVIVTTRPTGYSNDLPATAFERINLADLTIRDALQYGRVVTKVRIPEDDERRDSIVAALERAALDDRTRHLLRTPLQTLIMSIIAESSPNQFSTSRYGLFWDYYQTIAKREQNKQSSLAPLLRKHSQQILELHRRVGLRLQHQAETITGAESVLSHDELRDEAWRVLAEDGFDPSNEHSDLLARIVQAATHRLVLIAPRPDGDYGFDVRSLQELMAALALTTGELDETLPRLRTIAASPHWRNTFLFAVGRYFSEPQPHPRDRIIQLVQTLDDDATDRLGTAFPVGPGIAAAMITDGMVSAPKHLEVLLEHALRSLQEPGLEAADLALTLTVAAAWSTRIRNRIAEGLDSALAGSQLSLLNAAGVQSSIRQIASSPRIASLADPRPIKRGTAAASSRADDWTRFRAGMHEWEGPDLSHDLLAAASILRDVEAPRDGARDKQIDELTRLVSTDPNVALVLDQTLPQLLAGSPSLAACLRHEMMPMLWRRPVDLT